MVARNIKDFFECSTLYLQSITQNTEKRILIPGAAKD